jgi:hypothetical protein
MGPGKEKATDHKIIFEEGKLFAGIAGTIVAVLAFWVRSSVEDEGEATTESLDC